MLDLNRAQKEIQKAARDFARGEFDKDLALQMEAGGAFPERIWRKAGELGFLGLHFPEQYSGGGLGLLETVLVTETFCRQDASIGSALALSAFGAECLLRFGPEALKQQFLPALAEGRARSGLALTEPGVQADWSALQTRAASDEGGWIVNGRKTYVFEGGPNAFYIVVCRTGPGEISMILIEANRPGVAAHDLGRKVGFNMLRTAHLDLLEVRVPFEHLLGSQGRGVAQLEQFLDEARILLGAVGLGIAAGAFDRALAYVKEREAFGRKLAGFEAIRDKIADMAMKIEAARAIVYAAARRRDAGQAGILPSAAKMSAARAALEVADQAIQIFGGYGYMKETEVERFYRDAKMTELLLGGPPAVRKKIAEAVIGKLR
ncbi:MAG: acyl-CoA dehydrogenase [Desulfobacteraceae bacterium]|nr:MAG: acyl-CoA dehydrogenase [Desulfobacteraceae bacterium]